MDKPKKDNTVTIKINGEKQTFIEEAKNKEQVINNSPFHKVIKIDTSFEEEEVLLETAAAKESVDENFDWIIPESAEEDIDEYKVVRNENSQKKNKKKSSSSMTNNKKMNRGPLVPVLFSVIFAILLGTTFGFIMYKLVITDPSKKAVADPKTIVEDKGTKTVELKPTSAVLKPLTVIVVQEGQYSTKESAKDAADKVALKGIPTQSIEINGKHYLLLAVTDSMEIAKTIGGLYKEKGIKAFMPKSLAVDEKNVSDINESEKVFLETSSSIYQTLSKATSIAITTKAIPDDAIKELASIEGQLKITNSKNEKVKGLNAELTIANEKVKAYQKGKDPKNLNDAQQHLLNFLSYYYSL